LNGFGLFSRCTTVIEDKWDVPDRKTGYIALSELNPDRQWNFIEVNVTAQELQVARFEPI